MMFLVSFLAFSFFTNQVLEEGLHFRGFVKFWKN